MDEGQIARIVLEILKALDFLHSQSREHGSIGTSEVCIFGDGAIKLLTAGGPSAAPTETPFCCLAPEKIRMTESGMHSDIWSVGMLVREMMHKLLLPFTVSYCVMDKFSTFTIALNQLIRLHRKYRN